MFRRHMTYANVVATMALVFAMSGGALAAHHYLINSTKQINPRVLSRLKGEAGKPGATGAAGPVGRAGPAGQQGAQGKTGEEGLEGEPGTARAFGVVTAGGAIDLENPRFDVKDVLTPGPGIYCIQVEYPEVVNLFTSFIVATVSAEADPGAIAKARNHFPQPCNASGFEVDTFVMKANTTTGVITDEPKAEPFNFVIP